MTDSVSNTDELEPREEAAASSEDAGEDDTPNAQERAGEDLVDGGGEADESLGEEEEAPDADEVVGESLDTELLSLREDFEALNDRHLRLAAEFNNYRRRVEQERLDLWIRAQSDLMGKLLDVLDDLQRVAGLDLTNATVEGIMEGIDLVERKFLRVLGEVGVEVIDPVGEAFDPAFMEAMMIEPVESEDDDDRVARVFQKGYTLKGQLIRPARVSVHKHG
ncbi:MAG: nucleotide exchange factor GrpE [Gemmatimonadetes bacterium]|nr:nucleotide exchange factor GrpE [Gemmatimonadota bacterium]